MNVESTSSNVVANRLGKLAELYKQGPASDLTARTLDKLIEYETSLANTQLKEVQRDMAVFEARYQMSSAAFYKVYQAGETDDRMDFVEWASLIQMAENLQRRIHLLSAEETERHPWNIWMQS